MKKVLIASLLIGAIFSCDSKSKNKNLQRLPTDTVRTVALYINPQNGMLSVDYVFKLIKDTLKFESVDSNTAKKVWSRDSLYYVPNYIPKLDSLKKPIRDSAGNIQYKVDWTPVSSVNIVQDYNKRY